jgi:hypothetical protein
VPKETSERADRRASNAVNRCTPIPRSRVPANEFSGYRREPDATMGLAALATLSIRQYNCIDWQDEANLAKRLTARIEAMFGHGPLTR